MSLQDLRPERHDLLSLPTSLRSIRPRPSSAGLGLADAVEADLATLEGVDRLHAAIRGRPVEALLANAGRGLGKGFLDQDFDDVRTSSTPTSPGTLYLLQKVGRDMRARGRGRS
jgi:short-subunit dehydrogenase